MGLIKQMKALKNLTERERDICAYILENPEKIWSMTSRELGHCTFTSAASVTRFCQKLGVKGFPEFKVKFTSELHSMETDEGTERITMSEHENTVSMINKAMEIQRRGVEDTRKELSYQQILRASRLISEADYIDFYAFDTNVSLAQYGCSQFFHAGKVANTYAATNIQGLNAIIQSKGHISIIISHTGESERLIEIARLLKRKGAKIIVISSHRSSTLSKYADELLYAASSDTVDEFYISMFSASCKYLLDILFGMEFSGHYEENMRLNQKYEKSGDTLWGLSGIYSQ